MKHPFTATSEITIDASAAEVWTALTDPEMVKQYLFGTKVTSDWLVGSPITYTGEWEGKAYEDKGTILKIEPEKVLETTYWSSFSGVPDAPENYQTVTYELASEGEKTKLTVMQDNIATAESRDHSQKNWGMVLESLKKLLEA